MLLFRAAAFAAVGVVAAGTARAQPDDTPWSRGVTEANKKVAEARLDEGNALFVASRYREALARYRQAIAAWDHPAIRFNVARALVNLDKPVEAYDNVEKALAHGAAPFEPEIYREALSYKKMLAAQIAELEIRCGQSGAVIAVDGERFLACPGKRSARLAPGTHAVVGTKADHLTATRDVALFGGQRRELSIELVSIEDATVTRRRWTRWKPWAVVGAGAAVAGAGALLQLKARSDFDAFGEDLRDLCTGTGCTGDDLPQSTRNLESRARLENRAAIASMVGGAALVAGGLTLVFLNRPRPVLDERRVAPAIGAGTAGLRVRF